MAARTSTRSTVVAVRVHSDESYFLAGVTRDVDDVGVNAQQLKWRNNKTQIVGTSVVNKNAWLLQFRWLHECPSAQQIDTAADGGATQACGYKLAPAEKTVDRCSLRAQ
jgi:hypothetical protein